MAIKQQAVRLFKAGERTLKVTYTDTGEHGIPCGNDVLLLLKIKSATSPNGKTLSGIIAEV